MVRDRAGDVRRRRAGARRQRRRRSRGRAGTRAHVSTSRGGAPARRTAQRRARAGAAAVPGSPRRPAALPSDRHSTHTEELDQRGAALRQVLPRSLEPPRLPKGPRCAPRVGLAARAVLDGSPGACGSSSRAWSRTRDERRSALLSGVSGAARPPPRTARAKGRRRHRRCSRLRESGDRVERPSDMGLPPGRLRHRRHSATRCSLSTRRWDPSSSTTRYAGTPVDDAAGPIAYDRPPCGDPKKKSKHWFASSAKANPQLQ